MLYNGNKVIVGVDVLNTLIELLKDFIPFGITSTILLFLDNKLNISRLFAGKNMLKIASIIVIYIAGTSLLANFDETFQFGIMLPIATFVILSKDKSR